MSILLPGAMLVSLLNFVTFTLAPALVMIWTTSPELQRHISYSFYHVGSNPTQFMHMFKDIPGCSQDILVTSENLARSLICNDLELSALQPVLPTPPSLDSPTPPSVDPGVQVQEKGPTSKITHPSTPPVRLAKLLRHPVNFNFQTKPIISSHQEHN
ncbi:hypothetical protein DSO57_1010101 [Entomophthora muscae]|uniref:Uncharacterized protein n=1 Tax=Entomophthora muscae TaxID=34485 RepID=A0ACC2U553_9FUNG|nr:hypothetical protein DSO57_1010101 [Entomophthora muscae]